MAYSRLEKALHRLALGSDAVAEISFQIDQQIAGGDPGRVADGAHVFVCGFARAGTTVLMRRLHETGAFRSLTYADMPFVLAPNLWGRIRGGAGASPMEERAHGDGILVNASSPEGLEEVFWRVFAGDAYLGADGLRPHEPDPDLIRRFRAYVGALLGPGGQRYLSKNNNSILRLGALSRAFPKAAILVPFRAPLAHAGSLLAQHQRFTARHAGDRFSREYMTWLGHHEFGAEHRPFLLPPDVAPPVRAEAGTLGYWLERWIEVYSWLLDTAPEACVFVCYEDLCTDLGVWEAIADRLGLPDAPAETDFILKNTPHVSGPDLDEITKRADQIYDRLRARALQSDQP
ncbi:MAG: sulfotransferase [Pseudomonadota bacterium]